jgi:hypothetical protein
VSEASRDYIVELERAGLVIAGKTAAALSPSRVEFDLLCDVNG